MNRRILLVDRDSALRLMIEQHLRYVGYEVETSDEPRDAIERASLGHFDVIVASLSVPGLSGARLVEALGAVRPAPALVLVQREGEGEGADELRAHLDRSSGPHREVLTGSFDRSAVADAVLRAARRRHVHNCNRMALPKGGSSGPEGRPGRSRRRGRRASATRVGRYEVQEWLGSGATGTVYRCSDPSSGRAMAVKLIRQEQLERTGRGVRWLDRFRRAAGAAATVGHPSLVPLLDYGLDDDVGCAYLVSDLVKGGSLASRIESSQRLPPELAVRVAFGAADALAAVHEARMVHRRISPTNVLLGPDGSALVTDLAVGTALAWDFVPVAARPDGAGYSAPEQLLGRSAESRSDQFSLGLVLYESLAGRSPFETTSLGARARATVVAEPTPLGEAGVSVPATLSTALARMLAKDPADRFETDEDLLDALITSGADLDLELERSAASSGLL